MDKYREQLEGTTRLVRIRRIKRLVLLFMLVLIVLLAAYALASEGAGLKPFYFPLDFVLPLALILILVATATNFVFRILELKYSKRDSQRFLIAKHSIQRGFLMLTVCAFLGAVLIVPLVGDAARGPLLEVRTGTLTSSGTVTINLTSRDALALTQFIDGVVTVRQRSLDVRVTWMEDGTLVPGPIGTARSNPPQAFAFLVDGTVRLEYTVELYNPELQDVEYEVRFDRILAPALTSYVPVSLLALAATNGAWAMYLRPIRTKYEPSSIFGARHLDEVPAGERVYAEYNRQPSLGTDPPAATIPVARAPARGAPAARTGDARSVAAGPRGPSSTSAAPSPVDEGSRLLAAGNLEAALAKFHEALATDPTNLAALLAGATALLRLNRRDEASGFYRQVLDLDARNVPALGGLAEVYEADSRWEEAASTWARYEKALPEEPEVRLRHADALLKAGNRNGAVRILEEARRGFPDDGRIRVRYEELHVDVPGLLSKALVASASGRVEEAIALLDRILLQEPDNVNALVSKGVALRRAGRTADSLAILDAALQRQPTNTAALRAKGTVLEDRGAFEQALAVYEALHEANPRDPEGWTLQAAMLEKLLKNEEALAAYREAILLDPKNEELQERARALESSRGSRDKFMEELFTVRGMGPARVRSLLDAGYRSPASIRDATEDELANVGGMTRAVAKDLRRRFSAESPAA
jgi:tetratricopeptide (TPR) repeat protein